MARKLTLFNLKNKTDCTKLKEDQDYRSSLLCATDQQTKQGQALRRKTLNYNEGHYYGPFFFSWQ